MVMKMRLHPWIAMAVGVLVTATCTSSGSGSGKDPSPRPSGTEHLVVAFTIGDHAKAEARFGEETRKPYVGSHCWKDKPRFRCVDKFGPTAGDLRTVLQVPQGTELRIEGSAKRVRCFIGWLRPQLDTMARIEMTNGRAVLDQEPGKHALECIAVWPQGDVPFSLGIEIMPRAN